MAKTMKEAFVNDDAKVEIRDSPIPKPGAGQVLIKVIVSGSNPKDWKMPKHYAPGRPPINQGDDIGGYVEALGAGVKGFNVGDRVGAFHEMLAPHGSYAEYAIAWDYCVFHLPDHISFEEAATIPLAAMTSALGLYQRMDLPVPWRPASQPLPLVIYGGASAVGAFAIKLAKASNIHPIIAVAGNGIPFVEALLDKEKGDDVVDYRKGDDYVVEKIKSIAGTHPIRYAYDAVSEKSSTPNLSKVLEIGHAQVATIQPTSHPEGITAHMTFVGTVHQPKAVPNGVAVQDAGTPGDADFAAVFFQLFSRGLSQGWFSGHPYEVIPGGIDGVQTVLENLEAGKASATKYVVKIEETQGAGEN